MEIKLSEVLTKEIKNRRITLTDLSKTLSIPATLLVEWRSGRLPSGRSMLHLKKLADFFCLSLEELIFDKPEPEKMILASTVFNDTESGSEYKIVIEKLKKKKRI